MLNFFISTVTFSLAAYALNRHCDKQAVLRSRKRSIIVMVLATLISIAAGWAIDALDGEAKLHKNEPSLMDVLNSGDPVKIAKLLAGI